MLEPKQKYDLILEDLLNSIGKRDGDDRVLELKGKLKDKAAEGMNRELVVGILAEDQILHRILFLCLYPELIVPYMTRIRKLK